MSDCSPGIVAPPLDLVPYQARIVEFLKRHDPDVWNWFRSSRTRSAQADDLKFDLLKTTYRIDRESMPELYATADGVARQLGISAPITIYQAQDPRGLNASLAYLPDEVHVVLYGPLTTQLSPVELTSVLAHELTHFLLWQCWNGDLYVADQMLVALTNDRQAHTAHLASWRLLTLYNEIYCDRGELSVTGDLRAVVSTLVKLQIGIQEVNPDSYLKQADEIFARGPAKTEGITHPEAFIRVRAVKLWEENLAEANSRIAEMIESEFELTNLDLLGQEKIAGWTHRVIDLLLSHKWFQTDPVVAHARLYFEDYTPPADALTDGNLRNDVRLGTKSVRDYFCFVLLDFVTADRDLDEPSLAAALQVAAALGVKDRFIELAQKELRLRKNQLERVDDRKAAILQEADRSAAAAL